MTEYKQKYEELREAVRQMHYADAAYGCGFYGESSWLIPYRRTRELVGLKKNEITDAIEEITDV